MSRSEAHEARNTTLREVFSNRDTAKAGATADAIVIPNRARLLALSHEVQDVPNSDGAKIHWIGGTAADKVILYFHGGGYGLPAFDGHVIFLSQCAEKLKSQGHNTRVALLEYGLTTAKKYPTQFIQATEGLRTVLSTGYRPENVIVGGDSCGGNMALALISILRHGHPDIQPLNLARPLAGLLLISAWVNFKSSSQSYALNETRDIHMKQQMHEWATDFCTEEERNNYTEPAEAPSSWFKEIPVSKILNIFGSYELFRDDIVKLGRVLKQAGANVMDVECPMQVHIDCVLDAQTGLEVGPMSTETWRWLEGVF
ncbi:hypothetical protein LTR84_010744 [Exophiala bonariae]|uniref:Alpha/beta hydrolase fold-3 domain-containing protein n=1 Tax=Exophiala bonariae TaxID=1690606 RepID=A0AAV9MVW5_9EURO|nr:hypothetical protein LTR84_010744 [Exophiala bonariae]